MAVAYVIGFFALFLIMGWEPSDNREHKIENCPVPDCPMANQPGASEHAKGSVSFNDLK